MRLTYGTRDLGNIDIDKAEYSDDDTEIHFKEWQLIDHLEKIEENNLREISLWQDAEKELNELKEQSAIRKLKMEQELQKRNLEIQYQQKLLNEQM